MTDPGRRASSPAASALLPCRPHPPRRPPTGRCKAGRCQGVADKMKENKRVLSTLSIQQVLNGCPRHVHAVLMHKELMRGGARKAPTSQPPRGYQVFSTAPSWHLPRALQQQGDALSRVPNLSQGPWGEYGAFISMRNGSDKTTGQGEVEAGFEP